MFWKMVGENTDDPEWRKFAANVGNPTLCAPSHEAFKRLLEDPLTLNLRTGISFLMVLKRNIREAFLADMSKVKNEIFYSALSYIGSEEGTMVNFLTQIKPLFPRFLSEFMASSFLGLANTLKYHYANLGPLLQTCNCRVQSSSTVIYAMIN